jgi:hypothetical protein
VSRGCGTLKGVAADVIRGKGAWVLRRTSTMRVNIRVLVFIFKSYSSEMNNTNIVNLITINIISIDGLAPICPSRTICTRIPYYHLS